MWIFGSCSPVIYELQYDEDVLRKKTQSGQHEARLLYLCYSIQIIMMMITLKILMQLGELHIEWKGKSSKEAATYFKNALKYLSMITSSDYSFCSCTIREFPKPILPIEE